MATVTPLFFTLLFCFFFFITGGMVGHAEGQNIGEEKYWCIAKPSASDQELQTNLDYACGSVASCDKIKEGGPCFEPETLINRASVAMNIYYQEKGRNFWNCNFSYSALITVMDPSYGDCKYDG